MTDPAYRAVVVVSGRWCIGAASLRPTSAKLAMAIAALPFVETRQGWPGSMRRLAEVVGKSWKADRVRESLQEIETAGLIRTERSQRGTTIWVLDSVSTGNEWGHFCPHCGAVLPPLVRCVVRC